MGRLRLGLEICDFDLDRIGFALSVLDRPRHDGAGGYLRMSLDELASFISALKAAEDIELVSLVPEPAELTAEEDVEPAEPRTDEAEAEPVAGSARTADVITLPWLSRMWGTSRPEGQRDAERGAQVVGGSEPSGNEGGPRRIRVSRKEIRQPALL